MSQSTHLILMGGGGHASVVADAAIAAGWILGGVLDDSPEPEIQGMTVEHRNASTPKARKFDDPSPVRLGSIRELKQILASASAGVERKVHAAVGDNSLRAQWLNMVEEQRRATILHPSAVISPSAEIEAGVFVGPLAVINARARIGAGAIVNSAAVIEHDCVIGEFAHIAPRAVLCGRVTVGPRTLLGAGSIMRPGVTIGGGATIAAGAVVVADVPDGVTATGVPARWAATAAAAGR